MYFDLIRLGIPQSALVFIFIGRESRTPFQVGLHKDSNNKIDSTRTRTEQTGLIGQPDRSNWSASEPARFGCQQNCHHRMILA